MKQKLQIRKSELESIFKNSIKFYEKQIKESEKSKRKLNIKTDERKYYKLDTIIARNKLYIINLEMALMNLSLD